MIIIADSGSTKTDWCVVENGKLVHQFFTKGTNPFFQAPEQIERTLASQLLPRLDGRPVRSVFFYGAGCAFEEQTAMIRRVLRSLLDVRRVEVGSDMLAAARAGARKIIMGLGGSATNDGGCGAAAGLDVLFVLKARGAPVTVQVYKGGQHRQAACIEDGLALTGQRAQILADGSDLAVPNVDFEGVPLGVHSIDEQHLNLPPCFGFNGRTARGRAKKRTFPQRKSSKCEKRKQRTHSKNGCKLLFQFCAHHFSLHRVFSFSVCDLFRYILS